jgi:outer membrane protein TolC
MARNPRLKALRSAVSVARQSKSAASDLQNPEAILAWGNVDDELDSAGSARSSYGLRRAGGRLPVPNPFLIAPHVSARSAELQAAQAELLAAAWLTECDIQRLFAEIRFLSADQALSDELSRQNEVLLKDARTRAAQGAATAPELVAVLQRQLRVQNDLDQARHRCQLARRELAALLDLPESSVVLATNTPAAPNPPVSSLSLLPLQNAAFAHRGDLAALRWRAVAAQADYREARNERIPWFKDVSATHREPSDDWWVGLGITVPIFSWTANSGDKVRLAQSGLADVNVANSALAIQREVRDALDELLEQTRRQKGDQAELAPLLEEMRHTLAQLRQTPRELAPQVTTTETQIIESLRLDLTSQWQFEQARLNLERAVGAPLSAVLPAAGSHP